MRNSSHRPARRQLPAGFLALVVSLFVAACGDDPQVLHVRLPDDPGSSSSYNPGSVSDHDPMHTYDGVTIFADASENLLVVIDMNGDVVASLAPFDFDFPYLSFAKPYSNGRTLIAPSEFPVTVLNLFPARELFLLDENGNIDWQWSGAPEYARIHHETTLLESGNVLLLASPSPNPSFPAISEALVQDDVFLEINPDTDEVVWSWSTAEHYDDLPLTMAERDLIADQTIVDIFHTNSVHPLPDVGYDLDMYPEFTPGNLIVSQRQTNLVFIIDQATGDVVWNLDQSMIGNIGQHHPRMIPTGLPGAGNILFFDNGCCAGWPVQNRGTSRVLEIDPTDQSIVWSYTLEAFSPYRSGAQRLPNGNTLVMAATPGRFVEVAPNGDVVWQFDLSSDQGLYRGYRVDAGWLTGGNTGPVTPFPW